MHEVQAARSFCRVSLTAILFLVIVLYAADSLDALQKIKLAGWRVSPVLA
jgi:hypothetical protein